MADLKLEIVTPSKPAYSGSVTAVTVPGTIGAFQILKNHAPLISTFETGAVKVELEDKTTLYFATSGGTIEVRDNNVRLLADSLEAVEDIDLERAKAALERARKRLENKHEERINVARAEAALSRAMNRIKLVEKYLQQKD